MRCKRCKACKTEGFEYPEEYCCIGVSDDEINEDRNGDLGCNLHWKTINHLICKENEIPTKTMVHAKGDGIKKSLEKALFYIQFILSTNTPKNHFLSN